MKIPATLLSLGLVLLQPAASRGAAPASGDSAGTHVVEGLRSPGKAVALSLFSTAIPAAAGISAASNSETRNGHSDDTGAALMALAGLTIGPSVGHFYAGKPGRAFLGIGIRFAAIVGLAVAVGSSWDNPNAGSDGLAVASLAIGGASLVVDIVGAAKSARDKNDEIRRIRAAATPAMIQGAPGAALSMAF